jgi:hypothetical protein
MASLITRSTTNNPVKDVSQFLREVSGNQNRSEDKSGVFSRFWFRGVNKKFETQLPGVYRNDFKNRANRLEVNADLEGKRLQLECEMLMQFRTTGALFMNGMSEVDIYFYAQHFGMPTRLLDWTTNPLTALFFACDGQSDENGIVYGIDPRKIIPEGAKQKDGQPLPQAVMTMRHPFVQYAVSLSFWTPPQKKHGSHILPIRPDVIPGRISQQSSCFTLHMHLAKDISNPTLYSIHIDHESKSEILKELEYLNVNQFTTYYDLDHLSKNIKESWGV